MTNAAIRAAHGLDRPSPTLPAASFVLAMALSIRLYVNNDNFITRNDNDSYAKSADNSFDDEARMAGLADSARFLRWRFEMTAQFGKTSRVHLVIATAIFAVAQMASAAVLSVEAVTLSATGNPLDVPADVASVTLDGTEYTQLQGATFRVNPENASAGFYAYWDDDEPYVSDKVTREQALSGLNATDGTLQVDGAFTFYSSLLAESRFFLLELGSGDTASIVAVDGDGQTVATLNESLSWGSELYRAKLDRKPGDWDAEQPFVGTSFSLSDFDLESGRSFDDTAGIRIVSDSMDPAVFGLIVPEPTTCGLLILGGLAVLRRRS